MKLTPITQISRYLSIDGRTIVRIVRTLQGLDAYYSPPVIEKVSEVWGVCVDPEWDLFHEIGGLEDVLKTIATPSMVAAAAKASPRRFAEMVADAYGLGLVFYVASRAMSSVGDWVIDPKQFTSIEVTEELLNFHVLRTRNLYEEQLDVPGIYSVSFLLSEFVIQKRVMVVECPTPT